MIKYFFTFTLSLVVLFFYYQVSTYPYKVARWTQPWEARWAELTAKKCEPASSWLDVFLVHAVKTHGAYSAQIAFLSPNEDLDHCEIGYKNSLIGEVVTNTHRYRYASVSKLLTTAVIYKLLQQKKIFLEDRVTNFFPELKQFKDARVQEITISNLLDHSAGFNRLTLNGDAMFLRGKKPWCPYDMSRLQTIVLASSPGSKQTYSNEGYCLLGEVIKRVSGKGIQEYFENEFSLSDYNIRFIGNHYYEDEVRYDYRYEEWYNDSYLNQFDFEALASVAGLSGSAGSLARLLRDVNFQKKIPLLKRDSAADFQLQKTAYSLNMGVFYYRPVRYGMALFFHEGYLPGSKAIAVMDSYGGVTVLLKSGADRYQQNPNNQWVPWIYNRLTLYYLLQGKLPILNQMLLSSVESE